VFKGQVLILEFKILDLTLFPINGPFAVKLFSSFASFAALAVRLFRSFAD
jgi:hypothetical protein